jgi:hypothetical protein
LLFIQQEISISLKSITEMKKLSKIKEWMQKYNPRELLLWIQTTAIHPANQIYQIRFEVLLALLFSIPAEQFEENAITRDEFRRFVKYFEDEFVRYFLMLEDWQPFSQLKQIPYFFDKKKYFFFYGHLERPYEFLQQFGTIFLLPKYQETFGEISKLRNLFVLSLQFQNNLIEKIIILEESKIEAQKIYVPSQEYFSEICPFFEIDSQKLYLLEDHSCIEAGAFQIAEEEILSKCLDVELFKTFHIRLKENNYFLIPQLHLEILYKTAKRTILESKNKELLTSLIHKNFISQVQKNCFRFFTIRNITDKVLQVGTNKNLSDGADTIVRVDADKLLLFKVAEHGYEVDLSEQVEDAIRTAQTIISNIEKEEIVGLHYLNDEIIAVPVSKMEIWAIVVYENTTLNCRITLKHVIKKPTTIVISIIDLQAIFDYLSSGLSFIKFLKNDKELLSISTIQSSDYIDRFAYYISNGEAYLKMGATPTLLVFAPHQWHNFHLEKLFKKYQDDIFELIEREFPNYFNRAKKCDDNIYEVIETGMLNGGRVVKFGTNLVWIMYPLDGFNNTEDEISSYSRLLGPLYADYVNKLREPLSKLFKKYDFNFQTGYRIVLYPASYIERDEHLQFLKPYVSQLSQSMPLLVVTKRISNSWNIRSSVIYDFKYLEYLFAPKENEGERFCISQLIRSLMLFFNKNLREPKAGLIAQEFVDKYIPIRIKGYAFEAIPVHNPLLDSYGRHQDMSISDISRVNREVAEFLSKRNIEPGIYQGDDAKNLNNQIFQFLQNKLEEEIKEYNDSLLFHAYREVELIEGRREKNRLQLGLDASKYIEYDIISRSVETTEEISTAAVSAKYIVETTLKVGCHGRKSITDEDWHYLQALAVVLEETTTISDYIHYDIFPHSLKISDLYEIEDIKGKDAFSHEEFYKAESKLKVDSAKKTYEQRKENTIPEQPEGVRLVKPFPQKLQEVDSAFKTEYGFSLDNFGTVLYVLGCLNLSCEHHSPLSLVSEEVLIGKLKEHIKEPPEESEIKKILKFASLRFGIYKPNEVLITSQLLRRKERLNLCPLIYLEAGQYLYGNEMCLGASRIWLQAISSADIPYELPENSPIEQALTKLHRYMDTELEKEAEVIATQALGGNNVECRINNFKRLSPSFPAKPDCGEIDLLAVNQSTKTIFVIDAKNRSRKIRPYDIRQELKKFFEGGKSYLSQLNKKEEFVKKNLKDILAHFSIHADKEWKIHKAFVVSTNYPSAYYRGMNVHFVLTSKLADFLSNT